MAFDRIGIDAPGWVTPPLRSQPSSMAHYRTWPWETAEPVLANDVDGDGIADIGVYNHAERSSGPFMLLLGQPCPAT